MRNMTSTRMMEHSNGAEVRSPRRRLARIALCVAVPAVAVGGCGSAGQHATVAQPGSTQSETIEHVDPGAPRTTPIGITDLSSPVGLNPVASRYTCDGENQSPPLSWG